MGTLGDFIARHVASFLPVRIVYPYQRAVKFSCGHARRDLGEGVHWYIPLFQRVDVVDSAPQVINLPTQSITTEKDENGLECAVAFSAAVEFEIFDALLYWTRVQQGEESLQNMVMGHLARQMMHKNYEEVRELADDDILTKKMQDKAETWGMRVETVYLTDLVKHRAFRLFGDGATTARDELDGE